MSRSILDMSLEEEIAVHTDGIEGAGAQARIKALIRRAKAAEAALTERDTSHATALQAAEAAHKKALEEALTAHRAESAEEIALAAIGLADPLGRRLTREKWATLDAKTRPSSPAEYHRLLVEQARLHAEDATKPAPELDPWQRGYISVPAQAERPKVISVSGGTDRPADWTDDRIKATLGLAAKK